MRYVQRMVLGLGLIIIGFVALFFGSPARTGLGEPSLAYAMAFVVLFAVGFILFSAGILGMEDDYPAFLSGLVLYFVVGGLLSVLFYVTGSRVGRMTLTDASDPGFWLYWMRVAATWPLELVMRAGLFGYNLLRF